MTLNFEHSLRGSSVRSAHARALYALFVGALSFLILTATMVFYSIMTPSAYAETSSTGGDASYYEEVFTLDEATGEVTKTSVTRVDVPQESSASSNAAAQEPSRYSGSYANTSGSTNTSGVSAGASDSSFVTSTGNGKKIHLTFRALDQVNTVEACAGTVQIKSLDNTVIDGKSYTFLGWELPDGTLVAPGATVDLDEDATLTARWDIKPVDGSADGINSGQSGFQSHGIDLNDILIMLPTNTNGIDSLPSIDVSSPDNGDSDADLDDVIGSIKPPDNLYDPDIIARSGHRLIGWRELDSATW